MLRKMRQNNGGVNMNVGYTNILKHKDSPDTNPVCPICDSDVYGSKYGNDFRCINKECILYKTNASKLIDSLQSTIMQL